MRYFKWADGSITDEITVRKVLKLMCDPRVDVSPELYEDLIKNAVDNGIIIKIYDPLKEAEFDNVCGLIADCLGVGE